MVGTGHASSHSELETAHGGGSQHDALSPQAAPEDYSYYDFDLDGVVGTSALDLPSSSPPSSISQTSTTTTTTTPPPTTTTTTTTTPSASSTSSKTTSTTTKTKGTTLTRTRVKGRPEGASPTSRLGSSAGDGRRRTSAESRPPSTPSQEPALEEVTGGGEKEEEVPESAPSVVRRPPAPTPGGSPQHPRRRVVVRKRGEKKGASGQEQTSRPLRNKLRSPTSTHSLPTRGFNRPRPSPQLIASEEPEVRQRPTRPLVGISPRPTLSITDRPRPTRPSDDTPKLTRPLVQISPRTSRPLSQLEDATPHPFLKEEDSRPLHPLISTPATVTSPTTLPPTLAVEESITVFHQDVFPETTLFPVTSARPSFSSLFSRHAPTSPAPTAPTPTTISTPPSRGSPPPRTSPRPTISSTQRTTTTPPPPRSPRPVRLNTERVPLAPVVIPGPAQSSIKDSNDYYDYYYDDLGGALTGTLGQLATTLTEKAVLMADGSVQCNDTGYFAHPDSCKKFISCSKTVRGLVRGWVYTCPQHLVFDPVGGMCNWAETVDCEGRK